MNKPILANLAAATAALSAGAAVVATRIAVAETDPVSLSFYRYAIAVACLAPVLPFVWTRRPFPPSEVFKVAVLGALFFAFFPWAFSAALQYTTAARGAIGLATIPIQTLIVAAVFGREPLTRRAALSVGLAFAGIVVVYGPQALEAGGRDTLVGDGLMLLGAFSGALYSVFSRPALGRHGPMFVTIVAMAFGVATLLPLAHAGGAVSAVPDFSRDGWLAVVFLGTMAGAVQFSLYTWALRWLPPSRVVIHLTLIPISAMFLAVALLGERLDIVLVVGLLLVLGGIAVANVPWRTARVAVRPGIASSVGVGGDGG